MRNRLAWIGAVGAASTLAWALGCGGGGGGSGSGARIDGTLSRSSALAVARASSTERWLTRAQALLGVRTATAEEATTCGNPTDPAAGVVVDLLLDGVVVASTTTDAEGHFQFTDLSPAAYTIRVTLSDGTTITTPAVVQAGQLTTLAGEFDHDCRDVDGDGDRLEIALHVHQDAADGSSMDADETEDGGQFEGEVHRDDGSVVRQSGTQGDRSSGQ